MNVGLLNVVEISQCFRTKDTAEFLQFHEWPVVNTLCQEKKEHHNQKDGSKGTPRLDPYWKLQLVICMVSMELRSEFRL